MTAPTRPYDRLLRPISLADAHAEPEADSLFVEPGAYPKIIISTVVEIDGLSLNVTLHDMSISDAVALLRRQSRPERPSAPARRRHTRRGTQPQYTAVWADFGDEPTERGAAIVDQAAELLEMGLAAGWSNAIEQARQSR